MPSRKKSSSYNNHDIATLKDNISDLKQKLTTYAESNPYTISNYYEKLNIGYIHRTLYEYDISDTNDIKVLKNYLNFLQFWYNIWQNFKADTSSKKHKISLAVNEDILTKFSGAEKEKILAELEIAHKTLIENFLPNKEKPSAPIYYKARDGKSGLIQRQYRLFKKEKIPFVDEADITWFDEITYPGHKIDYHVINFICDRLIDLYKCKDREITEVIDTYYKKEYESEIVLFTEYITKLIEIVASSEIKFANIDKIVKFDLTNIDTAKLEYIKTNILLPLNKYIFYKSHDNKFKDAKANVDGDFIKKYIKTICFGYEQQNVSPYTKEEKEYVEQYYSANDCMEYKLLKMYLPIDYIDKYFHYDAEKHIVTLNDIYFKDAEENVSMIHNNGLRQLILGFSTNIIHIKKIRNFAINFVQWNTKNYCSLKTEWSMSMNNFFVYMFTKLDSPFPIRFILPEFKVSNIDIHEHIIVHDKGIEMQEIIINPKLFMKYNVVGASIIEYVVNHAKHYKIVFYIYNHGENKYDNKLLYTIDECGKLCYYGHILPKYPITYNEIVQLIKYMKGSLSIYKFKNNDTLPSPYNNMLFFTRYNTNKINKPNKSNNTNKTNSNNTNIYYNMDDIIRSLNLEKIDLTINKEKKDIKPFTYGSSILSAVQKGGSSLELSTKLEIYNPAITGNYFKLFDDYVNKLMSVDVKKKANYISMLYKYPFTGLQQFSWLKNTTDLTINPIYQPFSADFYVYYEIYKLFLENDIATGNKNITHISIGISPSMIEILEYENIKQESIYINIDSFKINEIVKQNINNVTDFITKHNIDCQIKSISNKLYDVLNEDITPVSLIVYNNFDWVDGFVHNFGHTNIINVFIGLLFGLKNTEKGGTFILHLYEVINNATADIYLIGKKYFETATLYYAECSNPYKKSGTYAIFKGFKGIKDFDTLLAMLNKIKGYYPNSIYDSQIYEKDVRKLCIVSKPIKGIRKPYINGLLKNADYTEIMEFNMKRYSGQYEFIKKLDKLVAESNPPINKITNEQILYSLMYLRNWNLPYNEIVNTNNLIQTKIGTQILNDIYGLESPAIYKFKSLDDYFNGNNKTNTFSDEINIDLDDLKFNVSMLNVLEQPQLNISQQILAERNKYNNKHNTEAYKLINAIQIRLKKNIISKLKSEYGITNTNGLELLEIMQNYGSLFKGAVLNISMAKQLWLSKVLNIKQIKDIQHLNYKKTNDMLDKAFTYSANTVIIQDMHLSQKNCFAQIVAGLIAVKKDGNLIIKLTIPFIDYPLINIIYILYDSFKHFNIIKPTTAHREYYIVAVNMNKHIDIQYLYNLVNEYDKTFDLLADEYPEYFISQFKYCYQQLIDDYITQSRKNMYLFDNYKIIDKRIKVLLTKNITQKTNTWLSKYTIS